MKFCELENMLKCEIIGLDAPDVGWSVKWSDNPVRLSERFFIGRVAAVLENSRTAGNSDESVVSRSNLTQKG